MSLRSAMAEHFGNLERMQGGGTVGGTTGEMWPVGLKGWLTTINSAKSLADAQRNYYIIHSMLTGNSQQTGGGGRINLPKLDELYKADNAAQAKVLALQKTGTSATAGIGKGMLSGLDAIFAKARGIGTTLNKAATSDLGLGDLGGLGGLGGDTYHPPEWRDQELELMQDQNRIARETLAQTQRSDQATLAERMGEIEAAEQQSRRTSLLEAAQALFTAAGTAAPPGMTTYPGYEEGGSADVLSKIAGTTTPASLKAPITRKPVSFDVLNAFDLGPLKEQIAAIMMGVQGAKKGLVSMADGGSTYMDDIARYNAGVAGKTPDEIALINRYLAGLGGGTGTSANSLDAIIGQAIYEADRRNRQIEAELQGATIPNVRNTIAQTMGYNDTGQPTMDMRQLLANTKANPRNLIEGLFLGRGMGLPADLSNVEAVEGGWQVPGSTGGGSTGGGGGAAAGERWQAPSGSWWQTQGDYNTQMARNVEARARDADRQAKAATGDLSGYAGIDLSMLGRHKHRAAEGKVVSGPAISTVGERGGDAGTEYAFLPPGAVVAPKPAGEKPSMDGALRAIAAQLFKSGLGGMATGGSVMGGGSGMGYGSAFRWPMPTLPTGSGGPAPTTPYTPADPIGRYLPRGGFGLRPYTPADPIDQRLPYGIKLPLTVPPSPIRPLLPPPESTTPYTPPDPIDRRLPYGVKTLPSFPGPVAPEPTYPTTMPPDIDPGSMSGIRLRIMGIAGLPGGVALPGDSMTQIRLDTMARAGIPQAGTGLTSLDTGGSVFSPPVTGTLPRSLLDAPALRAFMSPSNAGLSSIHKMPALFQPFGEGGPEAPNWLDPRAILAYAHGDPTERGTMESITSAYGWDPATALEMARRAMAGFGKPLTGTASYRPYWSWG